MSDYQREPSSGRCEPAGVHRVPAPAPAPAPATDIPHSWISTCLHVCHKLSLVESRCDKVWCAASISGGPLFITYSWGSQRFLCQAISPELENPQTIQLIALFNPEILQ